MKYLQFIRCFFKFFGSQNDYLFPTGHELESAVEYQDSFPYKKPHWWKTRMGFKTAFGIAKSIWL